MSDFVLTKESEVKHPLAEQDEQQAGSDSVLEVDFKDLSDEEIIEEIKKCRKSPVYFFKHYVKIKNAEGEFVPFVFNKFQKRFYKITKDKYWKPYKEIDGELYSRFQLIRIVLVKPRQIGGSSVIIAIMLWDNLFWPGTESSIFLHKDVYSTEMLEKLKGMLDRIPSFLKPKITQKDKDSSGELLMSKIHSKITVGTPGRSPELSGDKGRSQTYNNMMASEVPRYAYPEEFMNGVSAAARFGNQWLESTPLVAGDLFHEYFSKGMKGENEWTVVFVHWFEDERNWLPYTEAEGKEIMSNLQPNEKILMKKYSAMLNPGHIKFRRHMIKNQYNDNETKFIQEYAEDPETCFSGAGMNYFSDSEFEIKRVTILVPNRTKEMIWFRKPIKDHFHIISVDPSKGVGGDNAVIHVSDFDTSEQIAEYAKNTLPFKMLPYKIYEFFKYAPGMVAVEGNDLGHDTMATFRNHPKFAEDQIFQWMLWRHSDSHDGWYTGHNKPVMVSDFYTQIKEAVRTYMVKNEVPKTPIGYRIASENLVLELSTFLDLGNGKYGADENTSNKDDRVLAAMINVQMRKYAAQYKYKFFELLDEFGYTWETFRKAK